MEACLKHTCQLRINHKSIYLLGNPTKILQPDSCLIRTNELIPLDRIIPAAGNTFILLMNSVTNVDQNI